MTVSQKILPEKSAPTPAFTVWQSHLVNRLGIPIEEVRARRGRLLTEGVDWSQVGNRVLFTAEAARRLQESLHVASASSEESAPPPGGGANAAPAPARPVLIVVRSAPRIRNRHIAEVVPEGASIEDRAARRLLWVRDNTLFRVGHRIPPEAYEERATSVAATGELPQFNYTGRRPPK